MKQAARLFQCLTYVIIIIISLDLGLSSHINGLRNILLFGTIELLILLQYKFLNGDMNRKQCVINMVIPALVIGFFTCLINNRYGYGNTLGILGYKKECGILTLLEIPHSICVVLAFVFYSLILPLLYIKLRSLCYDKKARIDISVLCCLLSEIICMVVYCFGSAFIDALLLVPLAYLFSLRILIYLRNL